MVCLRPLSGVTPTSRKVYLNPPLLFLSQLLLTSFYQLSSNHKSDHLYTMSQGLDNLVNLLADAFSKLTMSKKDTKADCLAVLRTQYELLQELPTPSVKKPDLGIIRSEVFEDSDSRVPNFFQPWSLERLSSFKFDGSDPRVVKDVAISYENIDHGSYTLRKSRFPLYARLRIIHECFIREVQVWPRESFGESHTLSFYTGWKFLE